MRNNIWIRVLATGLVLGAPVVVQAQEVGAFFSVTPRADSPISDASYRPLGFVIVASHYYADNWFGFTGEIGYSSADLRSAVFDFEGGLRMVTGLVGVRFRPPGSKNWRFQPSVHFMGGVAMFSSTSSTSSNVFEVNNVAVGEVTPFPTDPDQTTFTFSTGVALHYEITPGKDVGVQWDAIGTNPDLEDLLIWRLAFGAVFKF